MSYWVSEDSVCKNQVLLSKAKRAKNALKYIGFFKYKAQKDVGFNEQMYKLRQKYKYVCSPRLIITSINDKYIGKESLKDYNKVKYQSVASSGLCSSERNVCLEESW